MRTNITHGRNYGFYKEQTKELFQQFSYLFENLTKTIEEGKQKLTEYEELINSDRRPSPPNQEKTKEKISHLEAERDRLQGEVGKIKNNSQMSESERKRKQAELEKELAAREAEIVSLRWGQKDFPPRNLEDDNSKKKNNNKLNWAIGLGIVAVVIALLCFIVLLARPKRRD